MYTGYTVYDLLCEDYLNLRLILWRATFCFITFSLNIQFALRKRFCLVKGVKR